MNVTLNRLVNYKRRLCTPFQLSKFMRPPCKYIVCSRKSRTRAKEFYCINKIQLNLLSTGCTEIFDNHNAVSISLIRQIITIIIITARADTKIGGHFQRRKTT